LRWQDIDIEGGALLVRRTLSDVGGKLVFPEPKTRASAAGVGLPSRVVTALEVQEMRQQLERDEWGEAYEDQGLVFARENGAPIRPEHVGKRFGPLCQAAGVPKIRIHDLRHTAATLNDRVRGAAGGGVEGAAPHPGVDHLRSLRAPHPGHRGQGGGHVRGGARRGGGRAGGTIAGHRGIKINTEHAHNTLT
jgi:hypothetical protein